MIFWIVLAALCLFLHFAPILVFNLVCNVCTIICLLLQKLCRAICHLSGSIAANHTIRRIPNFMFRFCYGLFGVLWIGVNLPDYIEVWMSERDMVDDPTDNTYTPSVISSEHNPTPTPSVASSSKRPCAGRVKTNGTTRTCKREKWMPDDEAGEWYCKDHEKKGRG